MKIRGIENCLSIPALFTIEFVTSYKTEEKKFQGIIADNTKIGKCFISFFKTLEKIKLIVIIKIK
ncbi:MAG: hypothetical protein NTZ48_06000, partial [Candidatus Omnitrophica bacterium]|nr:hypothetical protein [Candidatus Omnitrophota bacterium]